MRKLILILCCVLLTGCAGSITNVSQNYAQTSIAVKDFAKISSQDWLFASGIIRGAIPQETVPSWIFAELDKVDGWLGQGELTEKQQGYIVGLRLRMTGPILEAAIRQYAPGILAYPEIIMLLQFVGL